MSVRAQDLAVFAGGEALERYGVLVRRTTPQEDVPETYTRSGTAPLFDEYGYVRRASANTPRPSWLDLDNDGIPETPALPLAGAQTNLVEFNIPGGTPADWELQQLDAVTNLSAEYGLVIDPGDDYRVTMPANHTPGNLTVGGWVIPRWSDATTEDHYLAELYLSGTDFLRFRFSAGTLIASGQAGGVAFSASVNITAVVGTPFFAGLRIYGGTLYLYGDVDGDGSLTDDVASTAVGTFGAGTYTLHVGRDYAATAWLEGSLNLLITNDGSSAAPITDRFNAGAGLALGGDQGWLSKASGDGLSNAEHLVLSVGGNADGTAVEMNTYQGGTLILAGTATKGAALPAIDGKGGAWGIANATAVVATSEGIPLPYDSALGTKVVKLATGPAGSGVRRYLLGLPGELNGFSASTLAGCVVGVYIPLTSEVAAANVRLWATDNAGSSGGDIAPAKGKWFWLWATKTWTAGATEAYFELRFSDGVSLTGADQVLYLALPTACSGTVPVVPIPNAAEGSAAVAAETVYTGLPVPPGPVAIYAKWTAWAPGGVLYLGAAGATGARLYVQQDSDGKVAVRYTDGTTALEKIVDVVVTPGQTVQFLAVLTATGTIQAHLRVEGGALTSSTVSSALALPSAWGATRLYLGSLGGGSQAAIHLLAAKVVRGSGYTLDDVEAAA